MKIAKATARYEEWLRQHIRLIEADLEQKHAAMAEDLFCFLRATFYRWMQLWQEVCSPCVRAPEVLAVGDLHVENFGTWRDVEGRLVWGINDFDEAYELPYTVDLVRLATSAHLAIKGEHLRLTTKDACDAILDGYEKGLSGGGLAFVLEEHHPWLRTMVTGVLRNPQRFWARFDALPNERQCPASAQKAIEKMLPHPGLSYRVAHRVAGLGSLGRERYVAIAECSGGKIAREAKALAPSACVWAHGARTGRLRYQEILDHAVRSVDPFVRMKGGWIVRRLAPDCSRVELALMPKERDEARLLHSMGFETANVHLGTRRAAKTILKDLKSRPPLWLHQASVEMVKATTEDWERWRAHWRSPKKKPANRSAG
ncbi:MAG TPA: DUF2252 family protein [Bryobacteraceae bacterium]|nr:DUF2252 family protein [Bryobacteraceae bacterium]